MIGRLKLLYPFLFAVLPILLIVNRNPGASTAADVLWVLLTAVVGCALLYLMLILVSGRRWNPVVPLVLLAAIVWFYWYDTLTGLAHRVWRGAPSPLVAGAGLAATAAILIWIGRRPRYLERLTTFFGLTGLLLVGWSGLKIFRSKLAEREVVRRSALVGNLAQPVPATGERGPKRDIYLILLDEYANSAVLREVFGFDNRVFEDSLRQLGFTIPRRVQSNYIHTQLSLPSLLNFAHLTPLAGEVGERSNDPTVPNFLLENNRTVKFLKNHGYRFLFFPSQWWISTEANRNADWTFHAWHGFDLGREATRSDLRRSLVNTTALNLLQKNYAHDADFVKRTLAALEQVPERPEPTFAFAHALSPHRPYSVTATCEPRKDRVPLGGPWVPRRRQIYVDQVQCVNRQVLAVVSQLLRRSSVPPIIIIQGDHGTPTLGYDKAASAREVSPAQARERFGAFGAYYLPDGGGTAFADSVTLVNVFQHVLHYYFGAEIPASADRLYFSMDETPFSFVEFDRNSYVPLPASAGSGHHPEQHQEARRVTP
jgi:Sulfatase